MSRKNIISMLRVIADGPNTCVNAFGISLKLGNVSGSLKTFSNKTTKNSEDKIQK
jgi:hypothetical protein